MNKNTSSHHFLKPSYTTHIAQVQVCKRRQTKQCTHASGCNRRYTIQLGNASSKVTLSYNINPMHQVWEDFRLRMTPMENVCIDRETTSITHKGRQVHCSAKPKYKDGTGNKGQNPHNTFVSEQFLGEHHNYSCFRVKRLDTKTTFRFTVSSASMIPWNVWVALLLRCTVYVACA